MLKLSLYGFEFYLIRNQYTIFYFDMKLPCNSIFNLDEAIRITKWWIDSQNDWYQGVTSKQLQDKYDSLRVVKCE